MIHNDCRCGKKLSAFAVLRRFLRYNFHFYHWVRILCFYSVSNYVRHLNTRNCSFIFVHLLHSRYRIGGHSGTTLLTCHKMSCVWLCTAEIKDSYFSGRLKSVALKLWQYSEFSCCAHSWVLHIRWLLAIDLQNLKKH